MIEVETKTRSLLKKITGEAKLEGGGFPVLRPFPTRVLDHVDPFLLLDEAGPFPAQKEGEVDMNDHPHRGFETLTYVLSGKLDSHDSSGFRDTFYPGDIEWTTAGAGIIHGGAPIPGSEPTRGIQLWVNLPRAKKWITAKSQRITAQSTPIVERSGYKVKVLGGAAEGVEGPVKTTWPIVYLHYTLAPKASVSLDVATGHNVMLWILSGAISLPTGEHIERGELAILAGGDTVMFSNNSVESTELLLLAAKPINEPVARYGPFVMNTREEVFQAFDDFNAGKFAPITN